MTPRHERAVPRATQVTLVALVALVTFALGAGPVPATAGARSDELVRPPSGPNEIGASDNRTGAATAGDAGRPFGVVEGSSPVVGGTLASVATPVMPVGPAADAPDPNNPPGMTELDSVASDGTQGTAASGGIGASWAFARPGQAISADGRWVAFVSDAPNLVANDTNQTTDVFLRDRQTGETTRIPYLKGTQLTARLRASEPVISADGSVVAFTLDFASLGTRDTPTAHVFVWHRETNTTDFGSYDLNGRLTAGWQPSISADGHFLAYTAWNIGLRATNSQVVIRDLDSGAVALVSRDSTGFPGGLASSNPSVSSDGSYVAFESNASLLPNDGDGNGLSDIYVYDRVANAIQRVSISSTGGDANGASHQPSISGDGSVVAFDSTATNLTADAGVTGRASQVFVWERATGVDRLVSVGLAGAAGTGPSADPSVSLDGHVVGFDSAAPDLVPNDTNAGSTASPVAGFAAAPVPFEDVFLRDLVRNATIRISVNGPGGQVQGDSRRPSVSGDGRTTAFDSTSSGLVTPDVNQVRDVFVRDLPPVPQVAPNPVNFGAVPLGTPSIPIPVTVTNLGWGPLAISSATLGGVNATDFALAGDVCTGATLRLADVCTIGVLFTPLAPGSRRANLIVADNAAGSPRSVRLVGNAGGPTLTLDPPVGPPGFVTIAKGTGFPPAGQVSLAWDTGLNAKAAPVTVAPNGTFQVGVLIFHNDVEGPRALVATRVSGPTFAPVTAPFLVTVPTGQPPAFGVIRYAAPGIEPIVIRR